METRSTKTFARQLNLSEFAGYDRDSQLTTERLNLLLALNAETARQKAMYRTEKEKLEADLMSHPLSTSKAFCYFGLLLGTFPPATLFIRFAAESSVEEWVFGVMFIINLISAVVGYFSGKLIARAVREVEKYSWWVMLPLLPFIGVFWGIMAGGAGGIIVFVIGALAGAILGGLVGGTALPLFTVFHRLLKKGEMIERRHFLPLAFGITFTICSFILGL